MRSMIQMTTGVCAVLACACAGSNPPDTLVRAREAYSRAEQGPARRYDPAALHQAKDSLQNAEALYEDDADEARVSDAAYVALRRAQRADVEGETVQLRMRKEELQRNAAQTQAKQAAETKDQLASAREALERAQAARKQAEQRADEAMLRLELSRAVARVEEPQSTKLTVAGAFLFRSDEAQLLPAAHETLDKIASALKQQGDREIRVVGYTDSVGAADYNMQLSRERAEAVANYLASQGVARDKLTVEGRGESDPIASNDTASGRAQNRRVEITVQRLEPK